MTPARQKAPTIPPMIMPAPVGLLLSLSRSSASGPAGSMLVGLADTVEENPVGVCVSVIREVGVNGVESAVVASPVDDGVFNVVGAVEDKKVVEGEVTVVTSRIVVVAPVKVKEPGLIDVVVGIVLVGVMGVSVSSSSVSTPPELPGPSFCLLNIMFETR